MQDSYTLLRQRQKVDNSQTSTELESTPLLKRLHYYHELDEWQQDNHFIKSGYVKQTNSYKECFKSLTYLHNESVNIYSHLLPLSISFWVILYYIILIISYLNMIIILEFGKN